MNMDYITFKEDLLKSTNFQKTKALGQKWLLLYIIFKVWNLEIEVFLLQPIYHLFICTRKTPETADN